MTRARISPLLCIAAALCLGATGCAATSSSSTAPSAHSSSSQTLKEACDALNGSSELVQAVPELVTSVTALEEAIQNGTDTQAAGDKVTEVANAAAKGYEDAQVTNADLEPLVSSYVASLKDLAGAQTVEDYNTALGAMKETSTAMKTKCDGA